MLRFIEHKYQIIQMKYMQSSLAAVICLKTKCQTYICILAVLILRQQSPVKADEVSLLIEPNMCSWFEKWKIPKLNCHPRANNKSSFIYFYGRNNYDILFYLFFSFTSQYLTITIRVMQEVAE